MILDCRKIEVIRKFSFTNRSRACVCQHHWLD